MYAIVKTGGKQYKVQVGATIDVEKLPVETGEQIRLDQVLLAVDNGDLSLGRPVIDGAVVTARVVRQYRGPKLIIFKYKNKSRYRRRTGHRQDLTQLLVQSIEIPGWATVRMAARVAPVETAHPTAAPIDSVPLPDGTPTIAETIDEAAQEPRVVPALPTTEGTFTATGSAAPPNDILPAINPAAQVETLDENVDATGVPATGSIIDEPPAGLAGRETP